MNMDMGVLSTDKNEIKLIYNSDTTLGKQTLGYVSASSKDVLAIDTKETKLTGTQWAEITENIGVNISELINNEHPDFDKKYDSNTSLEFNDWIKVIQKNPQIIKGSILIIGDTFHHIINPSDFVRYMESDSAGVSRDPESE